MTMFIAGILGALRFIGPVVFPESLPIPVGETVSQTSETTPSRGD